MAKLYILTEEQIKSGKRPKTPRQKQMVWRQVCFILSLVIILEHIALYMWLK